MQRQHTYTNESLVKALFQQHYFLLPSPSFPIHKQLIKETH